MRRAAIFVATLLVSWVALAPAALAKPKLAVLGLEISDDGSTGEVVKKTADVAKLVTDQLRAEVVKRYGPYDLAPNSRKDLLEMKLLSNCSNDEKECLSAIGKELNSDVVLYGRVERRAEQGYWVELKLLEIKSGEIKKQQTFTIPFREAQPGAVDAHAAHLYKEMVGIPSQGTVVVRVRNSDRGAVYIDDALKGNLSEGQLRVTGLSPGKHKLRVVAPGLDQHAQEIVVHAEEDNDIEVELTEVSGTAREGGPRRGGNSTDKILFWSATAAAATAGGVWVFAGTRVYKYERDKSRANDAVFQSSDRVVANAYSAAVTSSNRDACTAASQVQDSGIADDNVNAIASACDSGRKYQHIVNYVAIPATAVFTAAAIYLGYRAYLRKNDDDDEDSTRASKKGRRRDAEVHVEPYVAPNLMGAGMTVTF
jgi:hypothetical protein